LFAISRSVPIRDTLVASSVPAAPNAAVAAREIITCRRPSCCAVSGRTNRW
jgi:hypothetical protein